MSTRAHTIILLAAVVAVVGVYLVKTALRPPTVEPAESGKHEVPAMAADSAGDMMSAVRAQMEHLETLEKQDPDNPEILLALGNMYYDAGMAPQAIAYYDRVLAQRPQEANVMMDKATMLRVLGRSSDAVALLEETVRLAPRHEQAWFNLGVIYGTDLNDTARTIAAWRKFLELSPDSPHAEAVRRELERLEHGEK